MFEVEQFPGETEGEDEVDIKFHFNMPARAFYALNNDDLREVVFSRMQSDFIIWRADKPKAA